MGWLPSGGFVDVPHRKSSCLTITAHRRSCLSGVSLIAEVGRLVVAAEMELLLLLCLLLLRLLSCHSLALSFLLA
jgi:hypothetical protein